MVWLRAQDLLLKGDWSAAWMRRSIRSGCPDGSRSQPGLAGQTFGASTMNRSLTIALVVSLLLSACAAGTGGEFRGYNNMPAGQTMMMPGA